MLYLWHNLSTLLLIDIQIISNFSLLYTHNAAEKISYVSPYEQTSLGCKCCAVGYNNLNYTAKVFINLYSYKQRIYSPTTSQAFGIVRFKLFCQADGYERVLDIFEMAEWCWVAWKCAAQITFQKELAQEYSQITTFSHDVLRSTATFYPGSSSSHRVPNKFLSTAVVLGPRHFYSMWNLSNKQSLLWSSPLAWLRLCQIYIRVQGSLCPILLPRCALWYEAFLPPIIFPIHFLYFNSHLSSYFMEYSN